MAEENTPVNNTPEQPVEPPKGDTDTTPDKPLKTDSPSVETADTSAVEPSAPLKAPELSEADTSAVKRKKFPTWAKVVIGIIVAVAVIIGIAIWGFSMATKEAVKVSDKLIADIQVNNVSDAYKLTNSTFQKATSENDLKKIFDTVSPELQGNKSINGKNLTKSNNRSVAVVVYTIETSGDKKYVRVVLEMDGSDWKVTNFRTSDNPLDTTAVN